MPVTKNLPILFLLFTGCTEQPPGTTRFTVPDPIVGTQLVESQTPFDAQPSSAPELYKVIKTVDGDTIDVLTEDKKTVRLWVNGINAPERGQPFGNSATAFISSTVSGQMVRLVTHGRDKYDRTIADIYLPIDDRLVNLPDMFLSRELIRRGLAWHYKGYSDDQRLADDEKVARSKKLGL